MKYPRHLIDETTSHVKRATLIACRWMQSERLAFSDRLASASAYSVAKKRSCDSRCSLFVPERRNATIRKEAKPIGDRGSAGNQ